MSTSIRNQRKLAWELLASIAAERFEAAQTLVQVSCHEDNHLAACNVRAWAAVTSACKQQAKDTADKG